MIAGLGFMVISYLLSRYPPSVIASFNFVSPISGVLLSAMLLGDQITPAIVGGVICVGVWSLLCFSTESRFEGGFHV